MKINFKMLVAVIGVVFAIGQSTVARCDTGNTPIGLSSSANYTDPVQHRSGFVTVNGIKLNYLDFGGKGDAIVMLPGLNDTAYIYDNLAPRFIGSYHVYALTRRGCGDSDLTVTDVSNESRVGDILGFLDAMKIKKAILIGHSLAGDELTVFAKEHPDRVDKLVYLEAAYDRSGGPFGQFGSLKPEEAATYSTPDPKNMVSVAAYRAYSTKFASGAWNGASEANMWDKITVAKDGTVTEKCLPITTGKLLIASATLHPDETGVKAPTLCFFATFADFTKMGATATVADAMMDWQKLQETNATNQMHAKVIAYPAGTSHYLFIQYPDRCAGEIKDFLSSK